VVEEKSVSLPESATRRLLAGLRTHLTVAEENQDGILMLIRVSEGTAQLGTHNPAQVVAALTKVLSQDEILAHLHNTELTTELAAALRGAIRLSEMRAAVAALRSALDEADDAESTYQNWSEKHSWAFGNAYVVRDEVREITPGDHLDLLLPTVIAGYRDLVELKRPSMEVLRWDAKHRIYFFSSDVSQAIGQCHDTEQSFGAISDRPERATLVALDPIVFFPSADLNQSCSLSCSFEKLRARPSSSSSCSFENCARPFCSLSRSVETRFNCGALPFRSWSDPPTVSPSSFILGWPN